MSQTEKYYRKYRKYKKQYLYYKHYLGGMNPQTNLANASINGANDPAATGNVVGIATKAAADIKTAQQKEINLREEKLRQQQEELQDRAALRTVQGLMKQKEGIDMQINSTLQEVKFDERMGTAINAELKGDIKEYQQDCQKLATDVRQGVDQVPSMVKRLARTINTHERQENGQYTLSKRGDKIEKMVLGQVQKLAGTEAKRGTEVYNKCKEEIHHEVGALINDDKEAKKLRVIRQEEEQKNKQLDAHAVQADTAAATGQ